MLLTDNEVTESKEYGNTIYQMLRIVERVTTKRIFDAALRYALRELDARDARQRVRNANVNSSVLLTGNVAGEVYISQSGQSVL